MRTAWLSKLILHHQSKRMKTSLSCSSAKLTSNKVLSLGDEAIDLRISGLRPNQKVTLHAAVCLPNSSILESFAYYSADNYGCIEPGRHECLGGNYKGIQPMGLLSFMKPSALNKRTYERFLIKEPTTPFHYDFRVFDGFVPSLEHDSVQNRFEWQPNLTITRTYMAPGVTEFPVWDGNVRATLYIPAGTGPFPGVISMSGGYPGAMKYKAALLASHGFAALALKYFGDDDLTDDFYTLKMEYIEEAAKFLINHPSVNDGNGIGIIANCYGATFALGAASVLPQGLIRCVASTNGWSFPMGDFTYGGKQVVSGLRPIFISELTEDGIRLWKFQFPVDPSSENVKLSSIPFFNRKDVSYLFVAGDNDGYVPSSELACLTEQFLAEANHPDFEVLLYQGAGHLIEHSYYPLASVAWTFKEPHFNGGKQPGHSIAQIDSWPRILDFVRKRLNCSASKL